MSSSKSSATAKETRTDAIAALTADHKKVKELFKRFEKLKEDDDAEDEKASLVKQICTELTIHTMLEEEIFYPAVREQIKEEDLLDEALVEHAGAKELVTQLEDMSPDDDLYDSKVTVLGEQIDHHVEEEEGQMFPKAKKAKVDTQQLGAQMAQRRTELKAAHMGAENEDEGGLATKRSAQPRSHD